MEGLPIERGNSDLKDQPKTDWLSVRFTDEIHAQVEEMGLKYC